MDSLVWAHRIVALVLGVLLLAWIATDRGAQRLAHDRARVWEKSIESMNVGVAM